MSDETDKVIATEQGHGQVDHQEAQASNPEEYELTVEQIEEWKNQASKAQENWDRLVRVSADFDNYKKRALKERQDAVRFANESLVQKLAPILDSLERALAAVDQTQSSAADALKEGVALTYNQLRNVLSDAGLEEIDAAGQPFDPHWHEAVSQQPSAEVPEGTVLHQIRKGFKLHDRLIRPASVVVAKNPGA